MRHHPWMETDSRTDEEKKRDRIAHLIHRREELEKELSAIEWERRAMHVGLTVEQLTVAMNVAHEVYTRSNGALKAWLADAMVGKADFVLEGIHKIGTKYAEDALSKGTMGTGSY